MAKVDPVPAGMHTLAPHFVCKSAAREIDFCKAVFNAEELARAMTPDGNGIWHCALRIGTSTLFLADEDSRTGAYAPTPDHPAHTTVWAYVADCDGTVKRAVELGAKVTMPVADMFWGDRVGQIVDPQGYRWAIATHIKDMTPEEQRVAGEAFAKKMRDA